MTPEIIIEMVKTATGFGVAVLALWALLAVIRFMGKITNDHNKQAGEWLAESKESRKAYEQLGRETNVVLSELKQIIKENNAKNHAH